MKDNLAFAIVAFTAPVLLLLFAVSLELICTNDKRNSGTKRTGPEFYCTINALSPKSDQDQFSPKNIHTLSTDKL